MFEQFYPQIWMLHIGCVALSGSLFTVRGLLRIGESSAANHRALRFASYAIDTTLLIAAILLTRIVHQYPFANSWLTAKVLLLLLYIGLGSVALKRGRTRGIRVAAYAGALLTFICMIGVAVNRDPAGWFASSDSAGLSMKLNESSRRQHDPWIRLRPIMWQVRVCRGPDAVSV